MGGSSVRGQERTFLVQLNESENLEHFQAEVIRLAASQLKQAEIFFGLVDRDSGMVQLPVWIKSHLERHPGLHKKLEQGEMAGIGTAEEGSVPRPASASRTSVVLIPVITGSRLAAAIGLVSSLDEPGLSAEDLETARQLAHDIAPVLSRLQEVERLRLENLALLATVKRAERAEEAIAALEDERNTLAATLQMRSHQQVNVAHELRTPLAAIRGYARMILDGRGGAVNEKQKDYLRIVTENTNRLIALVGWMSYVAELSAQRLKLSTFDVREIWTEVVAANQRQLAEKSLKLSQRIPEEAFAVIGDREKLTYALKELLSLAARLAHSGGTVTVELSHGREREVNFKLAQTGADIPASALAKIFDRPFSTLPRVAVHETLPETMSLSLVYDFIGMHGGRVFVNSTSGQGATFLFTLPAITAGTEEDSHEQAVNSSRRRR